MRNRLLTLTVALALTALASWMPRAEANAFCSPTFCAGKPLTTSCACPPGTGFPGRASNCGSYTGNGFMGCWGE